MRAGRKAAGLPQQLRTPQAHTPRTDTHTLPHPPPLAESVGGGVPRPRPVGGASAVGRQFIEDTYLQRKRRRERYK